MSFENSCRCIHFLVQFEFLSFKLKSILVYLYTLVLSILPLKVSRIAVALSEMIHFQTEIFCFSNLNEYIFEQSSVFSRLLVSQYIFLINYLDLTVEKVALLTYIVSVKQHMTLRL